MREPLQNDWLFSCLARLPTEQIVAILHISEQPVIELSAHNWAEDWQMANDLLRAYGCPEQYYYKPGAVGWDSLNEEMGIKIWKSGQVRGGRLVGRRLIGEVFIIRDCQDATLKNLAILIDIVYGHMRGFLKAPHLFPDARFAVVLADWQEPMLEARIFGHRVAFVVNSLPQDTIL